MRTRMVLACCVLAACGGGGGLSEEEADDAVDAAVDAAVEETGFEEAEIDSSGEDLIDPLEGWLECGSDAVEAELPDQLADQSAVLQDENLAGVVVLAVAYDGDIGRAMAGALEDDAVDCMEERFTDVFEESSGGLGDIELDLEVDEGDDVGDASVALDGTLALADLDIEIDFAARMASSGRVLVILGAGGSTFEAVDVLDDALEGGVAAVEEELG